MPTLFHSLNVGSEALYATRQGVDTAGHNIANAQVDGYSRQRVNIRQREPLQVRGLTIGNGVFVGSITRAHDKFTESQINKVNQDAGRAGARADAMKHLEVIFSPENTASVGDEMSGFFNSLQDLANFPEDFTVRTSVIEGAKNLTNAFRRVDADLKTNRIGLNERVIETTAEVTDALREIANLNVKIQTTEAGEAEQTANDLRDQRDRLLRQVSAAIDVTYYEDQYGMVMIRGPKQVTLVDGGHSAVVDVVRNSDNDGMYDVVVSDWENHSTRNVTDKLEGGSLAAFVEMRDRDVPALLAKNNELAYTFGERINSIHRQGFGLKAYAESTGRDFFRTPSSMASAASEMDLDDAILQSNDAIACASTPFAPGDNINLNQMIKLKNERVFGDDTTFSDFYADYVGALGLDVLRAQHVKEANDILSEDLMKRREAISGVSLDEEATNLLKWQTCFTANSKVITTVDEMLETVLSLKR